jgi:hypothetical protein
MYRHCRLKIWYVAAILISCYMAPRWAKSDKKCLRTNEKREYIITYGAHDRAEVGWLTFSVSAVPQKMVSAWLLSGLWPKRFISAWLEWVLPHKLLSAWLHIVKFCQHVCGGSHAKRLKSAWMGFSMTVEFVPTKPFCSSWEGKIRKIRVRILEK